MKTVFQVRREEDCEIWDEVETELEAQELCKYHAKREFRGVWPGNGGQSPEERGDDFDKILSLYYIEETEI